MQPGRREKLRIGFHNSRKMAKDQIHVAVVGAGLGGLAAAIGILRAGHQVTILEQAAVLSEIGAGIHIPPNATRILTEWGLLPKLKSEDVGPQDIIYRSYRDGKILSQQRIVEDVDAMYGATYLHLHRADYHRILLEEAERLGVKIRLGSAVTSINFDKPSVQIKDGSEFSADVILGADGINSACREAILGHPDPPHCTGKLAYRITIRGKDIRQHPDLVDFVTNPSLNVWIGPDAHAVSYLLKGGNLFNFVLVRPDNLPKLVNTAKVNVEEMLDFCKNWDPKMRSLLSIVQETLKWRLLTSNEMKTWSHPSGTCVLLGDACHAMLPILGQGAAQAVEDGAVLGLLFEKLETPDQLKDLLVIYEHIRKLRTSRVLRLSNEQSDLFYLDDGPEQRERDRQLLEEKPYVGCPNYLLDPEFQPWLYGFDAHAEVDQAWATYLEGRFPGTEEKFKVQ